MTDPALSVSSPSAPAGHDPDLVARQIASKIGTRARHVCFLLGAGTSSAAGLPILKALEQIVLDGLADRPTQQASFKDLLVDSNLEAALSRLRRLQGLLRDGESLGGIDAVAAHELDLRICSIIGSAIGAADADLSAFIAFASWAARMDTQRPLEVFTLNYDTLLEQALETLNAPYFDGFVGGIRAPFLADLVEPRDPLPSRAIPSGFVRIWKLHGSINWRTLEVDKRRTTIRTSDSTEPGVTAIFPSDEKYDEARRLPFVVLMDRFRRALVEPETVTIISGYSFGDNHINEMLFDAARRFPRSEVIACCFSKIPDQVATEALLTPNLVVLSPDEAIVGGQRAKWKTRDDMPGVYEKNLWLLGDFAALSSFLAGRVVREDA